MSRYLPLIINGHFRSQPTTGVQRYAQEVIAQFDRQKIPYSWLQPPEGMTSAALRQIWMQSVMPFKIPDNVVFWSPTNIGPIVCKKHVITLHDIAEQYHPGWYDKKYVAWRSWILPGLLKRARKILTTSNFARQNILEHYEQARGKTEVIYNGVNHDMFYLRAPAEVEEIKNKYHIKKPFVLNVSTLSNRKNTGGLLKAWELLPAAVHDEMELVIAGVPADNIEYNADIGHHKNVRFIGYVSGENLAALYSAAQLFVFPSFYESFGLPVLEAMACGTPVVTSNNTALNEVAKPALTINPHSITEISEAILDLVRSPGRREKMSAEGITWAARFTWEKTADEVWQVLSQFV